MRPAEAYPPHDPNSPHETRTLSRLAEVALALHSSTDFATLVDVVDAILRENYSARDCRIFFVDEASGGLRPWNAGPGRLGDPYIPPSGGLLSTVLLREEPLFLTYPSTDAPQPEPDLWHEECNAVVALPLASGGELHGVMVAMMAIKGPFSPADRVLFGFLGDALAVSLERGRRRRDLELVREQINHIENESDKREALLGQMLSVVAHEMRTPLTAIKAYAEALIDAPEEAWENRTPFLEIINEECDRLGRMIANALDYSRLESGQRSLRLATLTPIDLIGDVVMTLTPEGEKRNVKIDHDVPEDFGFVEGDLDLLKQLCINLAANAIKFSPENDTVSLSVSGGVETWRLEVRDHGVGISEDQREKIFQRFYRVEGDGACGVPGTGLGLAIARGIAELHGGRIWVAANAGGGSTFSVELPRVQRAPSEARGVAEGLWQHPAAQQFLDEAVEIIAEVMQASIISVMGVHPEAGDLRVQIALGLEDHARRRRVSYRGGIAGRALADAAPVLVNDIEADPRFSRPNHPQYFTKSLLCVPLIIGGQPVGVINVNNKRSREPFNEEDLALLTRLGERMASAMERLRAFPDAPDVVEEGLASLRAVTRRHRELVLGQRLVADYALALAMRMGATGTEARRLARLADSRVNSLLGHALPGDVAGRATQEKEEPAVEPVEPGLEGCLGSIRDIVLALEEWWDGSGQPHGIKETEIPLGARILTVVHAFHLWTSGRSYRPAMSPEDALLALNEKSGRHFDPHVVTELEAVLDEESAGESA
jgi:signal transduction histidine kinase